MTYDLYGGIPPHEATDTSLDAALQIEPLVETLRKKVFSYVLRRGVEGATCSEVEGSLGLRHQTASARLRELVLRGYLKDSGNRRKTDSKRNAIVWVAIG